MAHHPPNTIHATPMVSFRGLRVKTVCLLAVVVLYVSSLPMAAAQADGSIPQLNGQHFRITAVEEKGFLDVDTSPEGKPVFSGFLIDMLTAVAKPERANFTYTLLPPSGYGEMCSPRLNASNPSARNTEYSPEYRTQYNCGASDVNDRPLSNFSTDMYLGMYYVSPYRQLRNQFTIPFVPPFTGTLAMFGTATGIPSFESLVEQQSEGLQPAACAPDGTALIQFVRDSFPGIQLKGFLGGEEDITKAFQDGTCEIYITDGPISTAFVLRRAQMDECSARGKPIGTIGEPMSFGLSHYSIGIRSDIPSEVVNTISYWMNNLMVCNPLDPAGGCTEGNLASFFEGRGGTGDECGYVLFPDTSTSSVPGGIISGIVVGSVAVVVLILFAIHRYRMKRQAHRYHKNQKIAMEQANRERELNEFLAHEIRNPLSSAIAGLSFVSSMADDALVVPKETDRANIMSDIRIVDSSLQFVNELLRNMLDIHRTANKHMKLDMVPTDILRDVFEPVASILFMRGNSNVEISTVCPANLIVLGDRMRLKQIILNLSSNSSKFVQRGFIRLRAEVVKDNVFLYVEDSGPGIPASKQSQLFSKFQESLDSLNQGTGIGLSVCKNLSELMEADISLDENFSSGVDGCPGTRFTLRLNRPPVMTGFSEPSVEDNSCRSLAVTEGKRPQQDEDPLPENLKVLFVDDDIIIRKMFARSLSRLAPSWDLHEASNGETALRLVDEKKDFDLIFMDQYMASIEKQILGTEAVRMLRVKTMKPLVCGLSANDKEAEFIAAGADGFMLKPFPAKPELLRVEIEKLLRSRHHPAPDLGKEAPMQGDAV